jgi:hypothetical protein
MTSEEKQKEKLESFQTFYFSNRIFLDITRLKKGKKVV